MTHLFGAAPRGLAAMVVLTALVALGCRPATAPAATARAASMFERAVEDEARDTLAAEGYVEALRHAAHDPDDPWAEPVAAAALDALLQRRVVGGPEGQHAVVHRSARRLAQVGAALRRIYEAARHPGVKARVAFALADVAHRVGASVEAARWRWRAGCPHQVALSGPWGMPPLVALGDSGPVPSLGPMPAQWSTAGPFAGGAVFETVATDRGALDLGPSGSLAGVRSAVVDLPEGAPRALSITLSSSAAAVVEVGGAVVVTRPFSDGPGPSEHTARVELGPGRVRVVVRIADRGDADHVALRIVGLDGEPVETWVPRPGAIADARALAVTAPPMLDARAHPVAWARAQLAAGAARRVADALAEASSEEPFVGLGLTLARARASLEAHGATDRVLGELARWSAQAQTQCADCWETRLLAAEVARRRQGATAGALAALRVLGVAAPGEPLVDLSPVELARVVELASAGGLPEVARAAYAALRRHDRRAAVVASSDAVLFRRLGPEGIRAACYGGLRRDGLACFHARLATGDWQGATLELERLRSLRGSRGILREVELGLLLDQGDVERAGALLRALPPAQRPLAVLGLLEEPAVPDLDVLRRAPDAPRAFLPALRRLGVVGDPLGDVDAVARVAADRKEPFAPGAAVAILDRRESYRLDASGLLHVVLYDLRRIGGTTDVAEGTWVATPTIEGRVAGRWRLRRIHKADGRRLDADPDARGSQSDTELAQLEPGDYVESLYVAFALPTDGGHLVVDGPDLAPPRTSLQRGWVELRRPSGIPLAVWHHPRLGDGRIAGETTRWELTMPQPRRREVGVPPLEARVGLSFGTDRYARLGRALGERFAALTEGDDRVSEWARDVAGDGTPRQVVARVVTAVGRALRRGDPTALSDFVANLDRGAQRENASTMLATGRGSRTWLVHRALSALGIDSEVVVSETARFSADPGFPPRAGRFSHPLLFVPTLDLWIDADVDGPPLPAGRISAELRGRTALRGDGSFIEVPVGAAAEPARLALTLVVEPSGDAAGRFEAVLPGRDAQRVLDALDEAVGREREDILRDVVLAWVPEADVRTVELRSSPDALPLSLAADIALSGWAQPVAEGVLAVPGMLPLHRVTPRPNASSLTERFVGLEGRREALSINEASLYVLERTLTLPPGARLAQTPPDRVIDGSLVEARRRVTQDGAILRERFRLDLPIGTVSPEVFVTFAEDAKAIDDTFRHSIRIELP